MVVHLLWMLDRILFSVVLIFNRCDTLLGTNISYPPQKGTFKDVVPFPQVGYVSSLQNRILCTLLLLMEEILHHLGCIKPRKQWEKLPIKCAGFQPSTVVSFCLVILQ